jgi:hypothetical protein
MRTEGQTLKTRSVSLSSPNEERTGERSLRVQGAKLIRFPMFPGSGKAIVPQFTSRLSKSAD